MSAPPEDRLRAVPWVSTARRSLVRYEGLWWGFLAGDVECYLALSRDQREGRRIGSAWAYRDRWHCRLDREATDDFTVHHSFPAARIALLDRWRGDG